VLEQLNGEHPGRLRLLLREKNLGASRNFLAGVAACRGDYVALLEGDDYWADRYKLQKQAGVFDRFPDCQICGGRALTLDSSTGEFTETTPSQPYSELREFSAEDLLRGRFWMKTCTRMVPRDTIRSLPPEYCVDWLQVLTIIARSHFGRVHCLDDVVAVHRVHEEGVFSGSSESERARRDLAALKLALPLYSGRHHAEIRRWIAQRCFVLARSPRISARKRVCYWLELAHYRCGCVLSLTGGLRRLHNRWWS
jgi:glycosyltransferase involved in cell wall biosynthesis